MKRQLRTLATGIHFGEGPRWQTGRLWFSDFYSHRVCSVDLAGHLRTELEVEGRPSGLGWMPMARCWWCGWNCASCGGAGPTGDSNTTPT